ncbi:MAG: phosphodiester glycosidase family protein, partial [Anaerolineales bacterium]|nr:phosphodiester glycosidase family protein [Anaerolineales bacterium]
GGFPVLLRDGEIPTLTDPSGAIRNPRTAVALDDDYIYFVVVDGRNPGVSVGMTYVELAAFIRDVLGADWAINQDGGGSSTMVIDGQVINNTSGNDLRCIKTSTVRGGELTVSGSEDLASKKGSNTIYLPTVRACRTYERAVANGLMMVVSHPKNTSLTFTPGQEITTSDVSTIRLGPGTNYSAITTVGPGTVGMIVDHLNDLEGVFAKGHHWWKVVLGSTAGWVPETDIIPFFEPEQGEESGVDRIWLPFLPE